MTKADILEIPSTLRAELQSAADDEQRLMGDLLRDAVDRYLRERRWQKIFAYGEERARDLGLTEADVPRLISEYRQERRQHWVLSVTADTNIYISGLVFAGTPRQFLKAAGAWRFRLALSDALRDELQGVLAGKFAWTDQKIRETLDELAGCTDHIRPSETFEVVADEPDNRVLECAVAAGSRFVVTGDNDLLSLGNFRRIQTVKVAAFMALIETAES